MTETILICIPVFDDWENARILLPKIGEAVKRVNASCEVMFIDDGTPGAKVEAPAFAGTAGVNKISVVRLVRNMGHQRAIAIGMSFAANSRTFDTMVVMDGDGEDKPDDIEKMVTACAAAENRIIFASRTTRYETAGFKLFYGIYKVLFRLLTGIPISFGNFCLIPACHVKQLVCMSELWNHFTAGIIRSKIPHVLLPLERGRRVEGTSKMKFQSLVIHGLSAISVFIDTMAVRLLMVSLTLIGLSIVAIGIVFGIKIFTDFAIPGWASFVVLGLASVLLQAVTLFFIQAFLVLSSRSQKFFVPYFDYKQFIDTITEA